MSLAPHDIAELNAFVDGELELSRQLALEARLATDPALREALEGLRALRQALRERAEYHVAPAALRARLRLPLPHAPAPASVPAPVASARAADVLRRWFAWRPLLVGLGLAALLAGSAELLRSSFGADERLFQEVIASHVRSTVGQRLVDIASSDRHTVKPWLSGRLDYSPPVADVPVPGAVFVGGRVDYLDGRPVAALVYRQRQHLIDAYVWPGAQGDSSPQGLSLRGFNAMHWTRGGMRFWLVSDLNRDELGAFARALDHADAAR